MAAALPIHAAVIMPLPAMISPDEAMMPLIIVSTPAMLQRMIFLAERVVRQD